MYSAVQMSDGRWKAYGDDFLGFGDTAILAVQNLVERGEGSRKEAWSEHCRLCKPSGTDVLCSQCTDYDRFRDD